MPTTSKVRKKLSTLAVAECTASMISKNKAKVKEEENSSGSGSTEESENKVDWTTQKDRMDNHSDKYGDAHDNLPAEGTPNSSQDLYDKDTGNLRQRRFYDEKGNAVKDIDFEHNDPYGTHTFPHKHYWGTLNGKRKRFNNLQEYLEWLDSLINS